MKDRLLTGAISAALVLGMAAALTGAAGSVYPPPATVRSFDLLPPGWHNFVWTGPSATHPGTALDCIAQSDAIAYAQSGAHALAYPESNAGTDGYPNAGVDAKAHADTDGYPNADPNADTDGYPNAGADAKAHADTAAHADTDAKAHADTNAHAHASAIRQLRRPCPTRPIPCWASRRTRVQGRPQARSGAAKRLCTIRPVGHPQ